MRRLKIVGVILLVILCSGCSVGMALSGNEQKDTSVFYNGAERSFVIAKVGMPDAEMRDKDGNWVDTYLIVKGNDPSAGRAIGHGVMDVLTLGLWEVIGTPVEAVAGKEETGRFVIYYDADDKIQRVERIHLEKAPISQDANLKPPQPLSATPYAK
ncbi:MAG: hypothetical protein WBD99_09015 [Thermodesulfobacteriota bacterium]